MLKLAICKLSLILALLFVAMVEPALAQDTTSIAQTNKQSIQVTPPWAYPVPAPGVKRSVDDGVPKHLPGSEASFTLTQLRDLFTANDWQPTDHPPMPEIVEHGRKPDVYACAMCHMPNGLGRPENASLAGLPAGYIVQQMADFKSGVRKSSEPNLVPANLMMQAAKHANVDEVEIAAKYFAGLKYTPWIKVIETKTVAKARVNAGYMWAPIAGAGSEALGVRIVEIPIDLDRTELRDPRSGFIAYVPEGSIKRGEKLVIDGAETTLPCGLCHGSDLRGIGLVPRIAGRSPSYIVRQLYDMRSGARAGAGMVPMKAVVARLELEDMIAIAAYVASREP